MTDAIDIEALLRSALVPVEPAEGLSDRLERGLSELTDAAAGELVDWELSTMRDPRNWGRPVAAAVVGVRGAGGGGGGRGARPLPPRPPRQPHKRRPVGPLPALGQAIKDVASDL